LFNRIIYGVGVKVLVQMWFLTLSGFFAGIVVTIERGQMLFLGILNLLFLFSYSIWPSKATKVITVFGFIVWQLYGWVFGTLILFGGYPGQPLIPGL
jgi:hypothetical protein